MIDCEVIDGDDFESLLESIETLPEGCQGIEFPYMDLSGLEETFIRLFSAIPNTVKKIVMMEVGLGNMQAQIVIDAFSALKAPVQTMELYGNELNLFTPDQIKEILASLPRTLESVSLRGNSLDDFGYDQFQEMLQALCSNKPHLRKITLKAKEFEHFSLASKSCPTIKAVHLEDEDLIKSCSETKLKTLFNRLSNEINEISLFGFYSYDIDDEENIKKLRVIFDSLNDSVNHLTFQCMFGGYSGSPLFLASLDSLKPSVKCLTFKHENWETTPIDTLESHFMQLPPDSISSIILDGCQLEKRNAEDVAKLLAAFPPSVNRICIKNKNLLKKNQDYLTSAFSTLKASTLDFSNTKFTIEKLKKLFLALPDSVTELDLSNTNLYELPLDELIEAFKLLKPTVKRLNLNHNKFVELASPPNPQEQETCTRLTRFLKAIPTTVTDISLKHNQLFNKRSIAQRDALLDELREISHRLNLSANGESDFARALIPVTGFVGLPGEIQNHILSFLPGNFPDTDSRVLNAFNKLEEAKQEQTVSSTSSTSNTGFEVETDSNPGSEEKTKPGSEEETKSKKHAREDEETNKRAGKKRRTSDFQFFQSESALSSSGIEDDQPLSPEL
ncbi:hypothetical protein [Legionella sp.]|uniref:hypothetical protein n=1 Tax=Legionella sp. TaxID=459 RepID=UPI00321FB6A7